MADSVQTIGSLAIGVAIVGLVLGSFFGAVGGVSSGQIQSPVPFGNNDVADLQGTNITINSVNQSLGQSARLDGSADSYVAGSEAPDVSGDWTVSVGVSVENTTGTRIVYADDERLILFNGSSGEWVGVWYDNARGQTWSVSQLASNPANRTVLQLMLDGGTLSISEDATFSSAVATNDGNTTSNTFDGENLNGTVDEVRVFNDSLTNSERQQLVDAPTAPLTTAPRAYRVMFDSFDSSPSTYPAFFVGGSVEASSVTRANGFNEQPTERGDDWTLSLGDIVAQDGGSLDGAPVVYVDYIGQTGALVGVLETLAGVANSGVRLLAVGVIVAAAAVLMNLYQEF